MNTTESIQQVYQAIIGTLSAEVHQISQNQDGRLTPVDVAYLALKHGLSLQRTFTFLEWAGHLPAGTYDRLAVASHGQVGRAVELARQKYGIGVANA